jgi:hypothetical protein
MQYDRKSKATGMGFKLSDFEELATSYAHWCFRTRTSLHIAMVYSRGICIGLATNSVGSRSKGAGYSKSTIHAERAVLKKVGDTTLLRDASLVVIRIDKEGRIMNSEPCHACRCHLSAAMKKYGLRCVYHS